MGQRSEGLAAGGRTRWAHSFILSLNKRLLSACCAPGSVVKFREEISRKKVQKGKVVEWQVWHLREDLTGEVTWEQRLEFPEEAACTAEGSMSQTKGRQVQRPCRVQELSLIHI